MPVSAAESLVIGRKNDQGKRRYSLVPSGVMRDVVDVLMFGAGRYGDWNWLHVQDWRARYYDALRRHIDAWWSDDEWLDSDSGLPHLAHATVNAMFLLTLGRPEKAVDSATLPSTVTSVTSEAG